MALPSLLPSTAVTIGFDRAAIINAEALAVEYLK